MPKQINKPVLDTQVERRPFGDVIFLNIAMLERGKRRSTAINLCEKAVLSALADAHEVTPLRCRIRDNPLQDRGDRVVAAVVKLDNKMELAEFADAFLESVAVRRGMDVIWLAPHVSGAARKNFLRKGDEEEFTHWRQDRFLAEPDMTRLSPTGGFPAM